MLAFLVGALGTGVIGTIYLAEEYRSAYGQLLIAIEELKQATKKVFSELWCLCFVNRPEIPLKESIKSPYLLISLKLTLLLKLGWVKFDKN